MHASSVLPIGRSWIFIAAVSLVVLSGGCGGSSGGGGQSGPVGEEVEKPGGGFFFVDPNHSGGAATLHLEEARWGRLVDVHEIDASGVRVAQPFYRDMVVEPTIVTNMVDYVLDRDPVTQRERLTIQRQKTGVDDTAEFDQLLADARDNLAVVAPENIDSSPPFTTVPRNACISLRFDDCLNDAQAAVLGLLNPGAPTVKVATGYPPAVPFAARVMFDPNHGGVVGSAFHSTRVLVDLTINESEAAALPIPIDENAIGLPSRSPSSPSANVAIRVPTQIDLGTGQTQILTNLSGANLEFDNGPFDPVTLDVVRAFQSGNSNDSFNGFLLDSDRPRVIGGWPTSITGATDDPAGALAFDFLVDLTFTTSCLNPPAVGDVLTVGDAFLQVTEAAPLVGSDVIDLKARSVAAIGDPADLIGVGIYQAPFHPSLALAPGCWVTFLPEAATFPVTGVSTSSQILARFSEPMDPVSLSPFGNDLPAGNDKGGFLVVDGASTGTTSAARTHNMIVGHLVHVNSDLTLFGFEPESPFPHPAGTPNTLHVELLQARDLAGNPLRHKIPFVDFQIDPLEEAQFNDSIVLRFDGPDEYGPVSPHAAGGNPDTKTDLRGQFFYDTQRGSLIPRPVTFASWPVDRTIVLPQFMTRVIAGTNNPLNPLGAKHQMLWRYCDVGWEVRDETKYNLDIFGLSWAPANGQVVADFYNAFEIRLGHSLFLPDEAQDTSVPPQPKFPSSGFPASGAFEANYLPGSNPTIVHNRALGYFVNPSDLFNAPSGTKMLPFPLNRGGGPDLTYTWRDTSILGKGGVTAQPGIPLQREGDLGVNAVGVGSVASGTNGIPSFGLPLLIELRVFRADAAIGLNFLDVSLAFPTTTPPPITTPSFRAYSAGGIDNLGTPHEVHPDLEVAPIGGFNAGSTPPGLRTATGTDTVFYLGQIDTVTRVSRVHSVWLDTGITTGNGPVWLPPVVEPPVQPSGTAVQIDFRGANSFTGSQASASPYDSTRLDPYGEPTTTPNANFNSNPLNPPWSSNIAAAGNARRYLQVRFTFINNITTGLSPELLAIGLPYQTQ